MCAYIEGSYYQSEKATLSEQGRWQQSAPASCPPWWAVNMNKNDGIMDFHKSLFLLIFTVWHSLSFEISLRGNSSNTTINTKLLLFLDHLCASTYTVTILGVLCCCLSLSFIHGSRCDPHEERVDLLQVKPPHIASYKLVAWIQVEPGIFASCTVLINVQSLFLLPHVS